MFHKPLLAVLAAIALAVMAESADRRLLEAEEFDGLQRFPYHVENAPGWYARESSCRRYGAPGKGYHAQIHEGAQRLRAVKKPANPLPPGKYKVFARVNGHTWFDKTNVVEIVIGGASVRVEWEGLRKFAWKGGGTIETRKPTDRIELRAVQFGGKGYRQVYEAQTRTLAVDTIYITSDLSEKTGPTAAAGAMLELARDLPVEVLAGEAPTGRRRVLHAETPLPPVKPRAIHVALRSFDGRNNVWPNSSFEIGGSDGWAARNYPGYLHVFTERDHVKGGTHGQYCRRVPANARAMSRFVHLGTPGRYTLSLAIRGRTGKEANVHLIQLNQDRKLSWRHDLGKKLLTIPVKLASEWNRVARSADLPAGGLVMQVESDTECFIDAVQLEKGDTATPYRPRAVVEAGLSTDATGNILHDDRPTALVAWAHNSGARAVTAVLTYDIVNVREEIVARSKVEMSVPPRATTRKDITIEPTQRGLFSVFYSAGGRELPEGELVYAVLPQIPDGMPRHALACNMDKLEPLYELMKSMGHKWQLYCKLKHDWPTAVNPNPETWNWTQARQAVAAPQQVGFRVMPALWPARLPQHLIAQELCNADAFARGLRGITRATANPNKRRKLFVSYPDLTKWRDYCRRVAENLGDVAPWWTIDDETEGHYTPREFAGIVRATAQGFADAKQQPNISLSCMPDYTEELLAELDGERLFQGIGGSSYSMEYWDAVKIRGLQKRYGMDWHCIGVGQSRQPQMFHSFPGYVPVYASAARTARELVLLCLAQDARVIGHYTGRISAPRGLYNTDFPLMAYNGSPLPHGFSYSCVGLLLANAEPVEDVYLRNLDTIVFVYRQKGKLGAVTWANNTPTLDIHWKTWPRRLRDFTVPGSVDVLDMYGNSRSDVRRAGGNTVFDLGEEPVFILNRSMTDRQFLDAVRKATAAPPPVEMRLVFIPGEEGGIDLGVWTKNNTGKALETPELDARFPENRMVTLTSWMLPGREGAIESIPSGESTFGRLKTVLKPEFPVENSTFTVWLRANGRETPWHERCWMTVAPRLTPKLDGGLMDWTAVQPAWLYHTFSWGRFGRSFPQIVSGAENLKYCFRVDGRAAVRTAYDKENLYVGIRCEDDDAVSGSGNTDGDQLVLKFDSDLLGDFGTSAHKPDATLTVTPRFQKREWQQGEKRLVQYRVDVETTGLADVRAASSWKPAGRTTLYDIELAIPLAGVRKHADARAIGFDVEWIDADREGKEIVTSRMRWAGGSRTLGQLFFAD